MHCCINWGEETVCSRKNHGRMPKFANKSLEGFQWNQCAVEKTMSCFDKSSCFVRGQVNCMHDAVECESNRVLLACVVPIALIQFLVVNGFLSIPMTGYLKLGKK
jgi:hypothetical protein